MIEYVQDMQEKINFVTPIVRTHLEAAQAKQKLYHDCTAMLRQLQSGDWVLLLLPEASCKFLAK